MPRHKRPYVPKRKGCYECSQRRIHCDRTQPLCQKCVNRGFQCSGIGIRYRFATGLSSEAKNKGDTQNDTTGTTTRCSDFVEEVENSNGLRIVHPDTIGSETSVHAAIRATLASEKPYQYDAIWIEAGSYVVAAEEESQARVSNSNLSVGTTQESMYLIVRRLGLLDSFEECCLDYFSLRIAAEMVVIDDQYNGWRNFILPIAHLDGLVMDAVLATTAFHYYSNFGETVYKPISHYVQAIHKLGQRRHLLAHDVGETQRVVLAILVLLVTIEVSGLSDFPIIFKLLQSALDACDSEDVLYVGEFGQFLRREIQKLRVCAAPFLSQSEGVKVSNSTTAQGFESLAYYLELHPKYRFSLSVYLDLGRQAQAIYLKRATAGPANLILIDQVEKFKDTLVSLGPSPLGHHVLLWAVFIVASESSKVEHQRFFYEILLSHSKRNGWANLSKALHYLRRIWSRASGESWTLLLPASCFFITT